VWIPDVVEDTNFPKSADAARAGLHGACAFPIQFRTEIVGVVEFFSRSIREPDPELLAMMVTIGSQIGQFIQRKRIEEALGESEEQLRQSQKLEAIGQLAGGVAHDFNNLLTVIGGYSSILLGKLPEVSPHRSSIEEIKKASDRAGALTRQLLAFSRKQILQPKVLTFKVYVPRVDEVVGGEEEVISRSVPQGTELVLLVEDEDQVRAILKDILEGQGYHVLTASNGEEALSISLDLQHDIKLMITDVVMPQMSGSDLAMRVQAVRPNLPVLFMSGYTDDAIVRHGLLDEKLNFIQKPFDSAGVARKVREILDSHL
jgi:CheY-like chemotaxis protein